MDNIPFMLVECKDMLISAALYSIFPLKSPRRSIAFPQGSHMSFPKTDGFFCDRGTWFVGGPWTVNKSDEGKHKKAVGQALKSTEHNAPPPSLALLSCPSSHTVRTTKGKT